MKLFSEEMECEIIDKNIYTKGGRAMRLIGCTKYGYKSFLTPIEIEWRDTTKTRFLEEYKTTSTDYSDDWFILPEIEEEPDLLEHMIGYICDKC